MRPLPTHIDGVVCRARARLPHAAADHAREARREPLLVVDVVLEARDRRLRGDGGERAGRGGGVGRAHAEEHRLVSRSALPAASMPQTAATRCSSTLARARILDAHAKLLDAPRGFRASGHEQHGQASAREARADDEADCAGAVDDEHQRRCPRIASTATRSPSRTATITTRWPARRAEEQRCILLEIRDRDPIELDDAVARPQPRDLGGAALANALEQHAGARLAAEVRDRAEIGPVAGLPDAEIALLDGDQRGPPVRVEQLAHGAIHDLEHAGLACGVDMRSRRRPVCGSRRDCR